MLSHPFSTLVLATGNPNKVRELTGLLGSLGISLKSLADFSEVVSVDEDGETLAENARRKAVGYAQGLGEWVLADDTGLEVDALNGAPGILSARFAGDGATMVENRAKLLGELQGVSESERTARFVCCLAIANPAGDVVFESRGECWGRLRFEGTGEFGFGYDSLFEIVEYGKTLAEFGLTATALIGHRGRAVRGLMQLFG